MRRRFMWRIGLGLLLFVLLLGSLVALVAWLVSRVLDGTVALVVTAVLPLVAVVLVLVVVLRLVRRTAAPVSDLIEAAARVEAGDYAARVPERGPREVRSLARAFNAMSERLEQTDEARRRLLADVSHELRTPLTVMQGTLEGMLDGLYPVDDAHLAPVLEETRVLARLVEDLRTLSLSEAGSLRLHREPTDLGRLVEEVVAGHRAAADAAGVDIAVDAAGELPAMEVDAARIRQVVGNLVANALRFTPAGGSVTVTAGASGSGASVTVRDTGTGLDADALEHAFDRFYRSSSSTGSGLGLPIARNLVEAHGGEIEIESQPGSGTAVRFSLPPPRLDDDPRRP
jgi:two-component system, OmpR family, sensor histidine kinase BaeS